MKQINNYDVITSDQSHQPLKILLVDDQSFARRFIQRSLETDQQLQIVGTAQNGSEAIALVASLQPDVVLLDLEMPGMDGVTATEIIVNQYPKCKVLILSSYETGDYLQQALGAGATGYLLKGSSAADLINAVHSVHHGYTQLSPGLIERVLTPEIEVLSEAREAVFAPASTEDWAESTRDTVETLPRVTLRAVLYILLIFLGGVIPWAMFAQVDEIGTARGKLEPQGRVVNLGSPVEGKVMSVSVREGEKVTTNQQVMELDSQLVQTELQQQQQKLLAQQNQLNQLKLLQTQQQLSLRTQRQQSQAQQSEKKALIEQAQRAIESSKSAHEMAKIRYQAAQEKVPRYQSAYDQGALSQDLLADAQQQAQENQESVKQAASEIARAKSALTEQKRGLDSLVQTNNLAILKSEEESKQTARQITTLQGEIAQTQSAINGLEYQLTQRTLNATVSGTIFQLQVKKPGAVVQRGQTIAQIAPEDSPLVLRGKMSSSESGFLQPGLPVKVKFDAYPFQDYGVVAARLTWVSPDSRTATAEDPALPQGTNVQEFYEVEIELERSYISNGSQTISLTAGQTATAEIIIRQRRLVDVLLAPFKSLKNGGVQL